MQSFMMYWANTGKINLIKYIKAPILLEAVLAIQIMSELQYNLEEKDNSSS